MKPEATYFGTRVIVVGLSPTIHPWGSKPSVPMIKILRIQPRTSSVACLTNLKNPNEAAMDPIGGASRTPWHVTGRCRVRWPNTSLDNVEVEILEGVQTTDWGYGTVFVAFREIGAPWAGCLLTPERLEPLDENATVIVSAALLLRASI